MTTVVATQALQLLNDDFSNEQSELMAARIIREIGEDAGRQADRAYWLALSRAPTDAERRRAVEFIAQRFQSSRQALLDERTNLDADAHQKLHVRALADLCHVLFNSNEFVYLN